jgi:hypothetical protein
LAWAAAASAAALCSHADTYHYAVDAVQSVSQVSTT